VADKVSINIVANASKAISELKKVNSEIKDTDSSSRSAGVGLSKSSIAIGAVAAAATVGAKALFDLVSETSRLGDDIAKTARVVGVTGEELQGLRFAAERSAVSASTLESGLKRLSKSMFDASRGSKMQAETFRAMGVEVTTASGSLRPVADVFADIADHAQEVGQSTELAAQTMTVMGRGGADLANLLLTGSEGLVAYNERLRELGGVMSEELLTASEEYQDSVTDLNLAFSGFKNDLTLFVIPAFTKLNQALSQGVVNFRSFLDAIESNEAEGSFGDRFMDSIESAARFVGADDFADSLASGRAAERRRLELQARAEAEAAAGTGGAGGGGGGGGGGSGRPERLTTASPLRLSSGVMNQLRAVGTPEAPGGGQFAEGLAAQLKQTNDELLAEQRRAADEEARIAAELTERLRQEQEQRRRDAEATFNAQMQAAADVFGAVSTFAELGQQAVEEGYFGQTQASKEAGRAMFLISKAAALAGAAVNTALAVTNALKVEPYPLGVALAVSAGVAGGAQIATIAATTIQGLADAGLPPGALREAGLQNHTLIAMRRDEAVIDPVGTREISQMLALQRRQMEMDVSGRGSDHPTEVHLSLDGRLLTRGLMPYQTALVEDGYDFRNDVRGAA